jgi:hypothetical protein
MAFSSWAGNDKWLSFAKKPLDRMDEGVETEQTLMRNFIRTEPK